MAEPPIAPQQVVTSPTQMPKLPVVRRVGFNDLLEVLGAGLRDFRAAALYDLGIAAIYTLGGWLLILLLLYFDLHYLVYPLAAGFALVAPFIAAAFYAISQSLERGTPVTWGGIYRAVRAAQRSDLGWMALVTLFSLFIWMDIAALLFFGFLGFSALDASLLLTTIFTTPMGLLFLLIGHLVGAVIALAVFSFSVISVPLLFDRPVDFVTAMITSVKVVLANRKVMVIWCATIAILIGLSLLSGFVGLLLVLPVLGHTSWHLYNCAVAPADDAT